MKNGTLKRIFQSRTFYIVFSIIASIALWTYVEYAENPDVNVTVSGISIEYEGENTLKDNNLIVTNVDTNTLTLRFTGKRNTVTSFSNSNISVSVDLSEIAKSGLTGVYQLSYTIHYPEGVNANAVSSTSTSMSYITVTVERLVSKTVEVAGLNQGSVADGYQAEPLTFDYDTITVSGPESVVQTVDHAQVTINRSNVTSTVSEQADVVLVDKDGAAVDLKNITLSQNVITVTLPIKMVKEVALAVTLINGASANDSNTVVTISPAKITLSGDPDVLQNLNQVVLGTVDLTTFTATYNETMNITLPNNVVNLSGETTAAVAVRVVGLTSAKLSATNITTKNAADGYAVTIITQSLDVTLRGSASDLSQITSSNIRIVADLSELGNTTGTFSVTAAVSVDGFTGVDAIGTYTVTVALTETSG